MKSRAYHRGHKKVRYWRGEPDLCVSCGGDAQEWANRTGDYDNIYDYDPMCRSCHRSRDRRAYHDRTKDHKYEPLASVGWCRICHRDRTREYRASLVG